MLVLNNQVKKEIYILEVPANTFKHSLNKENGILKVRKDKPIYIDLNIDSKSFVDSTSKVSFKKFLTKTIKY